MKKYLLILSAALLSACASAPPPPDWQANSFASLSSYTSAYLSGNTRVANFEFERAKNDISSTGRADLMARAELVRCAAQVASLVLQPCTGYLALATDAQPPQQAYAAFISGQWATLDPALLPPHYRSLLLPATLTASVLGQIQDPLARLIAAGVLLHKGLLAPVDMVVAVETASAQGWRRPLLAWLGVQLKKAQAAGDGVSAAGLQRRIDLVLQAGAI